MSEKGKDFYKIMYACASPELPICVSSEGNLVSLKIDFEAQSVFQIIWFVALIAWQLMGWLLMFQKLITVSAPVPFHSSGGGNTTSGLNLSGWFVIHKAFRSFF